MGWIVKAPPSGVIAGGSMEPAGAGAANSPLGDWLPLPQVSSPIPDPPPTTMSAQVKDKEAFQRLSFLYQAAHCVLAQNPENQVLVRFYCHAQRSISRRLVLRQPSPCLCFPPQGPIGEENHLQILLLPPGPWRQLHRAPEKASWPALVSCTVSLLWPDQALPKQPRVQAVGGAA
ncbi:ribonuclease P protein subunit p21 isoform X3 [Lepidochelys kempii]|uniref:ribonuclease P protein subunit p21 isoform X3 n=1 Tax=Lepidochelys kempii TaxID=8472 RepID=UPI003C6F11A3